MRRMDKPGSGEPTCCFVFVHGILSDGQSAWTDPPADQTPAIKQMADRLVQELGPATPAGLGVNCISYHWELGVRSGALELLQYVNALAQSMPGPIYLIGHSMGGLVCRYYLERLVDKPGWRGDRVAALVTLATPHHGSQLYVRAVALLKGMPLMQPLAEVAASLEAGLLLEDALHSEALAPVQFLADLMPASAVLQSVNSPFTPPPRTTYIAAGVPDDLLVMDYPGEIMHGFTLPHGTPPIRRPSVEVCRDDVRYSHRQERLPHTRHSSLNYNPRLAAWLADELRSVHQRWQGLCLSGEPEYDGGARTS